jgi:hypothetical protein
MEGVHVKKQRDLVFFYGFTIPADRKSEPFVRLNIFRRVFLKPTKEK